MRKNHKISYCVKSWGWKIDSRSGGKNISESEFQKDKVFLKEFSNFRRLDSISKTVCSSIALVLQQVDLYPSEKKYSIPVFFYNPEGTLHSDLHYYSDFIKFNQTAGRANLFIYTLPTSPLGEASVHFGLTGGISYISSETPLKTICENVIDSCDDYSEGVLIGIGDYNDNDSNALFIYLKNDKSNLRDYSIEELSELEYCSVVDLKNKLEKLLN